MAVRCAKRREATAISDWARIGAAWEIGIGEPVVFGPGEHELLRDEDTLVRFLFGRLQVEVDGTKRGVDAGWVVAVDGGTPLKLDVQRRAHLRLIPRARIERAHRLWGGYQRCLPSQPAASGLLGAFLPAGDLADIASRLGPDVAVVLHRLQGPLSQSLAALPRDLLPTLDLQRPLADRNYPEALPFYGGGDRHLLIVEALTCLGSPMRDEEVLLSRGGVVLRWTPLEGPEALPFLEGLSRAVPDVARVARDAARAQQMFEPVRLALAGVLRSLAAPLPLALVRPLSSQTAQAWNIGPIPLSASPRPRPLGDGDYEVAPGAVGGEYRTCAIVAGPASTAQRLVVDIEFAAQHEVEVHRCSIERRDGIPVVGDIRCIARVD